MSNNLTLLLLMPGDENSPMQKTLQEWNQANLLGSVGWLTSDVPDPKGTFQVNVESHIAGSPATRDFFDLLTSRIWDAVTVVGLRDKKQDQTDQNYYVGEQCLLELVRTHLSANKDVVIRGVTVGVADEVKNKSTFSLHWDLHLLLEPKLYIDSQIASQPLVDSYRASSVLLLGMLASGGFRWQRDTLIGDLRDPSIGINPRLRIARANLRVVNAGRLTDRILEGAFPESGPWSQPSDINNGVAMPMGAHVPAAVVESLAKQAKFNFEKWVRPSYKNVTQVGLLQGIMMFLKYFFGFLRQAPLKLVEEIKEKIVLKLAEGVQALTFGADSGIQLAYNPNNNLSSEAVLELVKKSGVPELDSPIADSRPWRVLRSTALCLVDGGKLPDGIAEPLRGAGRMLFLDPSTIGPPISDAPFKLDEKLKSLLDLPVGLIELGSLDVENVRMVRTRINHRISASQPTSSPKNDTPDANSPEKVEQAIVVEISNVDRDFLISSLADLDKWLDIRKNSLLWIVASTILSSIDLAREEMNSAFKNYQVPSIAMEAETKAQKKARTWTFRGLIGLLVVALTAIFGAVFAIFSAFLAIGAVIMYLIGLILRCATLARDLAALQFKRVNEYSNIQAELLRGHHSAKELVRLLSARSQLNEWQEIIREIVHAPFGRSNSFETRSAGISTIHCPPQFVLATAEPSEDQMTSAMSGAKDQTIHAGWLNESFETLVKHWSELYKKWSAAGAGDDLSPEMDNVDSGAVRGYRPLTKEPLLYPRSDFHRAVLSGSLRDGLVQSKVDQIAINLRRTPLKELLAHVSVTGLGKALSGQSVDKFLDGLQVQKDEILDFGADLFSARALQLRVGNIGMSLPPPGQHQTHALSESVRPGEELVAVASRIDLSVAVSLDDLSIGQQVDSRKNPPKDSESHGDSPV